MTLFLSQFNPEWASKKIGNTDLTIGRFGCTLTCLSMALADFDLIMSPPDIAKRADWFTKQGLLIWGKAESGLRQLFSKKKILLRRHYGHNDLMIRGALRPGSSVLLEVAGGSHWIKADRKMILRNDYNCRDPLRGRGCAALGDYYSITGYSILQVQ